LKCTFETPKNAANSRKRAEQSVNEPEVSAEAALRTAASIVIARSEATKQSSLLAAVKEAGLLRFARNDGGWAGG
jgi:hypothetical protein